MPDDHSVRIAQAVQRHVTKAHTYEQLGHLLGVHPTTAARKVKGAVPLTVDELWVVEQEWLGLQPGQIMREAAGMDGASDPEVRRGEFEELREYVQGLPGAPRREDGTRTEGTEKRSEP